MSTAFRRRRALRYDERGSGSVLMLAAALLLLFGGLAAALWTAVSTGHHRAASAADLAALSAAQALQAGDSEPCRTATRIAATQQATIIRCDVRGDTVQVLAGVRLELGVLGRPVVESSARAGPIR